MLKVRRVRRVSVALCGVVELQVQQERFIVAAPRGDWKFPYRRCKAGVKLRKTKRQTLLRSIERPGTQ